MKILLGILLIAFVGGCVYLYFRLKTDLKNFDLD